MAMLRSVLQSFCDPVICAGLGGTGRPKRYGVISIGQPFRLIGPNVGAQMVQKGAVRVAPNCAQKSACCSKCAII